MAQADVLQLVDDFAGTRSDDLSLADSTATARYYADVVYENGLTREASCDAAFVQGVIGTAVYDQPDAAIRVLMLCYDDVELRPATRQAFETYDADWRARRGRPHTYITQDEDTRDFRLVPVPLSFGEDPTGLTPFDATMPMNDLTFIYTDNVTDVLPWDELWVALEVAAREFGRESDHYDQLFARTAKQLASVIRILVGYDS